MAGYSDLPHVDEAFGRWVREEDPPANLYEEALSLAELRRAIQQLEPDVKVHEIVHPSVELSALALAVKATKLVPGVLYAQVNVHVSRLGRLGLVAWEWKLEGDEEPTHGVHPPGGDPRTRRLEAGIEGILVQGGAELVPWAEAEREVRVEDDPLYDGKYYEIKVFEALFGMGYPERQR